MTGRIRPSPKPSLGVAACVAIGLAVAVVSIAAFISVGLAKFGAALIGLALLTPSLIVRNPRKYGIFLLVVSIPIEFSLRLTKWLVNPDLLFRAFGMPSTGTLSIDIYATDVLLLAMLLPWLIQICTQGRNVYFPKIALLYVVYLAWAVITSFLNAPSLYLSFFQLGRQLLFFLFFIYIINNVKKSDFRTIMAALLVCFSIEAAIVIIFFVLGIGSDYYFYRNLLYGSSSGSGSLAVLTVADWGKWSHIKRSAGTFAHPSIAAYYFEYILPVCLGFAMVARRIRYRVLLGVLFAAGTISLLLTFSRSGLVGFLVASAVFLLLARWSGFVSRRFFMYLVILGVMVVAVGTPLVVQYLETRPAAVALRWELLGPALDAFAKRPFLGSGLNNSSAVTKDSLSIIVLPTGHSDYQATVVHSYYMVVLIEVGVIGFTLFFSFFWGTLLIGLRHLRAMDLQRRVLLTGIIAALVGISVHNLADPYGGQTVHAMLWLYLGLIIAICRSIRMEPSVEMVAAKRPPAPNGMSRLPAAAAQLTLSSD